MTNLLTSLDELIWKQYEKITQKAAKLGYSKYDLASLCGNGAAVAVTGCGSYVMLEGILDGSAAITGIGAACAILGYWEYKNVKIMKAKAEERDTRELVRYGAVSPPQFIWSRPLGLGLAVCCLGKGANYLIHRDLPAPDTLQKLSTSDYVTLEGLISLTLSAYLTAVFSATYFHTQIPRPPQKKFWQSWYEKLAARFQKPAEVPMKQYTAEVL